MFRLKALLLLLAVLTVAALWWWSQREDAIVVGIDAPLVPETVFDPSELNTSDLFFDENADTLIRPRILYYGIKAGDGQTVFDDAMAEGVNFLSRLSHLRFLSAMR